jgi:hypothetical protein
MGQLIAEETAKRGELQDAQAEEGLKQVVFSFGLNFGQRHKIK